MVNKGTPCYARKMALIGTVIFGDIYKYFNSRPIPGTYTDL
jgi:hypothetical protein